MKLGTLLAKIAETEDETREQLKVEFLERIRNHREEKLLMECYSSACAGRKYISFGRNAVPPEELKKEGFTLKASKTGFNYHFC